MDYIRRCVLSVVSPLQEKYTYYKPPWSALQVVITDLFCQLRGKSFWRKAVTREYYFVANHLHSGSNLLVTLF